MFISKVLISLDYALMKCHVMFYEFWLMENASMNNAYVKAKVENGQKNQRNFYFWGY